MASALYEIQRQAKEAVAVWAVHVAFPAFEDLPAKDFYWSTGRNIELDDGQVYTQHLTDIPRGRHQTDRGNDYAEISVSNPDNALYQELLSYENLIEKAEITIRQAYEVSRDLYESEIKFYGYLKDFTISQESHALQITAVSDISRQNFLVGNRIITRERCGTEFNANGAMSSTVSPCGWQTTQGGNPLFCTKRKEGPDGCRAHNNLHRYYAVLGLSTATVEVIDGDPGGWNGGNSGPCFSDQAYVVLADWTILPISQVFAGQHRILGFDLFREDALVKADVLSTTKTLVGEICEAVFDTGTKFEVRKDHLFYLGDRLFAPVAFLEDRAVVGMDFNQMPARSRLSSIQKHLRELYVYNLHTSSNNYIVTDKDRKFYAFVHNAKPIYNEP